MGRHSFLVSQFHRLNVKRLIKYWNFIISDDERLAKENLVRSLQFPDLYDTCDLRGLIWDFKETKEILQSRLEKWIYVTTVICSKEDTNRVCLVAHLPMLFDAQEKSAREEQRLYSSENDP